MELDYSRHYRKWHPNADEHYESSSSIEVRDLKDYPPHDQGAAIFELGAGMGLSLYALRKLGFTQLVGVDSDRSQVEAARSRGLPVEMVPVTETLDWLHQRRGAFDFAFAIDVLEHIPRQHLVEVVRAVAETLKPGATFVCRVPNCNSIVGMRQRYLDWTHEDAFSPESLDFVLYNGGFPNVEIVEASSPPLLGVGGYARGAVRLLFRSIRRLQYFGEATGNERRIPLSSNLLAICRR
jgi:SAM-dependent methyltransferase